MIVPELPGHGGSAPLRGAVARSVRRGRAGRARARGGAAGPVGRPLARRRSSALRAAVLRPDAVDGLVLAAAAGISSSTRAGELTVTLARAAPAGPARRPPQRRACRRVAARGGRSRSAGGASPTRPGSTRRMAEAFLAGPPRHTDTLTAGPALVGSDPRHDLDRVGCPCLCLWGATTTGFRSPTAWNTPGACVRRSG